MKKNHEAIAERLNDLARAQVDLLEQLHVRGRLNHDELDDAVDEIGNHIYAICTMCGMPRDLALTLDPFKHLR